MRAAPPLVFPSSRVLAGWWVQLRPRPPHLAVGHLLLHHVEALVRTDSTTTLDRFSFLVLRAVALASLNTMDELEGRLHLGPQVVARVLDDLAARGLTEVDAGGRWRATAAGTRFVQAAGAGQPAYERRSFHFRDLAQKPFLPLQQAAAQPVLPREGWSFDPAMLTRCVAESEDWKRRHGFPLDVREVLSPDSSADGPPAWQRVIVDQPCHLALVLAAPAGQREGAELLGFTVDPRSWQLSTASRALSMGPGWTDAFPELVPGPSQEAWRHAWRGWCQLHGVPPAEAEACTLTPDGVVLRIAPPRDLHARWPPGPREDIWLLAGDGMMKVVARVEMTV